MTAVAASSEKFNAAPRIPGVDFTNMTASCDHDILLRDVPSDMPGAGVRRCENTGYLDELIAKTAAAAEAARIIAANTITPQAQPQVALAPKLQ